MTWSDSEGDERNNFVQYAYTKGSQTRGKNSPLAIHPFSSAIATLAEQYTACYLAIPNHLWGQYRDTG